MLNALVFLKIKFGSCISKQFSITSGNVPINPNGGIMITTISSCRIFLYWYHLILKSHRIFVTGLFQSQLPYLMIPCVPIRLAFPNAAHSFPSSSHFRFSVCILASLCALLPSPLCFPSFLLNYSPKWIIWFFQPHSSSDLWIGHPASCSSLLHGLPFFPFPYILRSLVAGYLHITVFFTAPAPCLL